MGIGIHVLGDLTVRGNEVCVLAEHQRRWDGPVGLWQLRDGCRWEGGVGVPLIGWGLRVVVDRARQPRENWWRPEGEG